MSQHYEQSTARTTSASPSVLSSACSIFNDVLSDDELIKSIEKMKMKIRYYGTENDVLENFLQEMEPALLNNLQQLLETTMKVSTSGMRRSQPSIHSKQLKTDEISATSINSYKSVRFGTASTKTSSVIHAMTGIRINISQRMELVNKEMDKIQNNFEIFKNNCDKIKSCLKAELEEISLRIHETKDASQQFEINIVKNSIDPITGRIPAEKFVWYMKDWLKNSDSTIEKLRLRNSTLKTQMIRQKQQLKKKEELGETLNEIDFDQLKIENKEYIDNIEMKNHYLLELKKLVGRANLSLTTNKKFLQKQLKELKKLNTSVAQKNDQLIELKLEEKLVNDEMEKAYMDLDRIKRLRDKYTVPDVSCYVKKKAELAELQKSLKVWTRKRKVQQIAINSCLVHIKKLTKTPEVERKASELSFEI